MTAPSPTAAVRSPARAARPSRRPLDGAALPPLDALDHTHQQMLQTLVALSALVQHLQDVGLDNTARQRARSICAFFDGHAREHHAAEEAQIFPMLVRAADKAIVQQVMRLQQDHGWLEEDWLELSPQLQAVAGGYSWYDLDTLRAATAVFTTLYQEHIALEESMIYPAARRQLALDAEQQARRVATALQDAAGLEASGPAAGA